MTEKKFIISEDKIKEIELHLKNHSLIQVKAIIKQLPIFEDENKKFMEKEIEDIEIELCRKLDEDLYLPVKEELKGINRTYSLGIKKENFKLTIHNCLIKLQEVKDGII